MMRVWLMCCEFGDRMPARVTIAPHIEVLSQSFKDAAS